MRGGDRERRQLRGQLMEPEDDWEDGADEAADREEKDFWRRSE